MNPRSGASQYYGSHYAVQLANDLTFNFGQRYSKPGGRISFELALPYNVGIDESDNFQPTEQASSRLEAAKSTELTYLGMLRDRSWWAPVWRGLIVEETQTLPGSPSA
jgi:hypothetical protein